MSGGGNFRLHVTKFFVELVVFLELLDDGLCEHAPGIDVRGIVPRNLHAMPANQPGVGQDGVALVRHQISEDEAYVLIGQFKERWEGAS